MLKEVIEYYENKKIKLIYHINENGKYHGPSLKYHKNGNIFLKTSYKNGMQCGIQKAYDENNKLYFIISYKLWLYHGPFIIFNYNINI